MAIAALIVAIVSVVLTGLGLRLAKRSMDAARESARAASKAAAIEEARRHGEMSPRYLVTLKAQPIGEPPSPGRQSMLHVKLARMGEVDGLDAIR